MRLVALCGLAALAALVGGCGVLTYPDRTMLFFPIYDDEVRSDLNLRRLSCERGRDGRLVINASIVNQGSNYVFAIPLLTGDRGAFRTAATVTWADGSREVIDGVMPTSMAVPEAAIVRISSWSVLPDNVTRIDVVADADQIVRDPIRDNNMLTWQGTMNPANPQCDVAR